MSFFADGGDGARPATAHAREDHKARGLQRMRRTAVCLLVVGVLLHAATLVVAR
ncbi:hypothetical protein [Paraburkholderia ultramafica]|uniref:hypothetical protein n=1 Tax=Paraburkholderia ultramafica TaxID=1544867 RepID=UPI001581F5CB|nr:hypothetical protein [Paraburkholderia ultramafica]